MMDHESVLARLDAFLDGDLPSGEQEEMERHLRACVPCAKEAAEMRRLLERARALPDSLPPARDLWPEVAARLPHRGGERRRSFWRPALAAAAALAVVLVGLRLGLGPGGERGDGTAGGRVPQASLATNSVLTALDLETAAAGKSLEAALDAGGRLGPQEGAAINTGLNSLAIAIAECRLALAEDPENPELLHRLTFYYRERLELLEKATRLLRA